MTTNRHDLVDFVVIFLFKYENVLVLKIIRTQTTRFFPSRRRRQSNSYWMKDKRGKKILAANEM